MHLFEITATRTDPIAVFASSYALAVEIYMAWWLINKDCDLPDLQVRQRNPDWPGINQQHLHRTFAAGIAGIGTYDANAGWAIAAPATAGGVC